MNEEKKKIYLRVLLDVVLTLAAIGLLYLGGPLALEIMTPFILAFIMAWAFSASWARRARSIPSSW